MIGYVGRVLTAHLRSGRSLLVLTLFGVALGVGSVLSIQIINRNALGAFEGSVRAISGEADLTVFGRSSDLPEEFYAKTLAQPEVAAAWPLYRVDVAVAGHQDLFLEVIGVDLFAPMRIPFTGRPSDAGEPLRVKGWAAITPEMAELLGVERGGSFEIASGSRRVPLHVGALVDFREITPLAGTRVAVMDISQAQHALGGRGRLHQIDLRVADGQDAEQVAQRLESALGPTVKVLTPEQRGAEAAGLLGAFRLNITALSLISLFVGGFLVYASTQAALVRRRGEFGVLRALGATRGQLLFVILGEIALLAVVGALAGVPLGWGVAAANMERVSRTLSNLYLLEEIERLQISPWLPLLAGAIGVAGALAGGLLPALDASRRDARALLSVFTLHERIAGISGRLALTGLTALAVSVALYFGPLAGWKHGGFVVGIGLLIALPLASPWVVRTATVVQGARSFGLRYGIRALGLQLQTSAVAVAALAVAVSMLVGITLMVGSFRRTVEIWLEDSAKADIYITGESWQRGRADAPLEPWLVDAVVGHDGVRLADRLRQVFVDCRGRRVALGAIDFGLPVESGRFQLYLGERDEAFRAAHEDGAALISEPLARRTELTVGDRIPVAGPRGEVLLPVAAVFYDYASDSGSLVIDMSTMDRIWGPGPVHTVALYLDEGLDPLQVVGELKTKLGDAPVRIRSNRDLRAEVFKLFDQTFAVTRLLQAMSLITAVSGITLTLIVLARERVSELALYRALGARRRQIFRVWLGKGLGLAFYGLGLGAIGGLGLALVLIFLINRDYFGWTLAVHWPWGELAREAAAIVAASVLASLYPALRASRTPAGELTRESG